MSYIGSSAAPLPIAFSGMQGQSFNGGTNTFTLSRAVARTLDIDVVINNVAQNPYDGSYSVNGTTLTTAETVSAGVGNVYVIFRDAPIGSFSPIAGSVTPASMSVGAPFWDINGNVGVGTNSPVTKLDIAGTIRTSAGTDYGSYMCLYDGTIASYEVVFNTGLNNARAYRGKFDQNGNLLVGVNTVGSYAAKLVVGGDNGIGLSGGTGFINDNKVGRIRPIAAGSNPYAGGIAFDYFNYNGSSYVFAEGMRLDGNGNLLVGITSAITNAYGLSISTDGRNASATVAIKAHNGAGYDARVYMECPGVNAGGFTYQRSTGRLYSYSQTENSGPYVVPNGTSWTTNSDERLKTDISDITYGLDAVMELSPKQYKYKTGDKTSLGLIAQQTALVIPEIVDVPEDAELMMGIEYTGLIPVLVKAIQEQQAIIEQLKTRIDALEA